MTDQNLRGGLKMIELLPACGVDTVEFDFTCATVTGIGLTPGVRPVAVPFCEDGASYTEIADMSAGYPVVKHTLMFRIRIHGDGGQFCNRFTRNPSERFIAIMTANDGSRRIAGLSETFATECAMRVASAEVKTGEVFTDDHHITITLTSTDDTPAYGYLPEPDKTKEE